MAAIEAGKIVAGDVVVIRYEGPKGGPGMREMLSVTGAIVGAGLGASVALITDGRSGIGPLTLFTQKARCRTAAQVPETVASAFAGLSPATVRRCRMGV